MYFIQYLVAHITYAMQVMLVSETCRRQADFEDDVSNGEQGSSNNSNMSLIPWFELKYHLRTC